MYRQRSDGDRVVGLGDEDVVVLPEQTGDDTDAGWGKRHDSNEDRLWEERPPHWD